MQTEISGPKHVLIVEDDADILESLVELLETEGFTTTPTSNGQEALDYLHACPDLPQLILLDLMMPVKDAFQFRQEQRLDPRISEIPVMLMSADGQLETKKKQLGFQHCLKKPFEIDTLISAVKSLCH